MSQISQIEEHQEFSILKKRSSQNIFIRFSKAFPVLIISLALHLVILLIIAFIPGKEKDKPPTIIHTPTVWVDKPDEVKQPDPIIQTFDPQNFKPKVDINSPPQIHEKFKPPLDIDTPPVKKIEMPDFVLPTLEPTTPSYKQTLSIGPIKTKFTPGDGIYDSRNDKNRKKALTINDGDEETEQAVEQALLWLQAHQERNGSWDASKHEGKAHNRNLPVVATACAILPFYGAGHTEKNRGDYKKTVDKGIRFIISEVRKHKDKPQFGSNYGAALILMALSESYIMANNATSKKYADVVAKYLIDQYMKSPGQGWGYNSAGTDLSVTGWVSLALKTAKVAQLDSLKTKDAKFVETSYKKWLENVTDATTGMGSYKPGHNPSPNMTYVAMFVQQALGISDNDPFLKAAAQNTVKWANSTTTFKDDKAKNLYGVYYGTLAAFQSGGSTWQAWNPVMKRSLVFSQRQGDPKELGGSWDPTHDHTGEIGGRVYTTALLALTLEIYYRYSQLN